MFLGDFAVLLKAGMTARQAIFYNLLSSILCFVGMILGVLIGNMPTASLWIFSAAAGMFLYIALVDMVSSVKNRFYLCLKASYIQHQILYS